MKGKNVFTQREIKEIAALICQRCSADRGEQKQIRAKMRRIGFYGQDDFGVFDMTEEKFYKLIESGRIKVSDVGATITPPSQQTKPVAPVTSNKMKAGLEAWCSEEPYVLILGTFPSEKSLAAQAYYQNKSRNSFYKIMECLFDRYDGLSDKDFITSNHIALWDCMKEADREGNLDANIKDYVPNEIEEFLFLHPTITAIVLNGIGDTAKTFEKNFSVEELKHKCRIISLPSTSNANAMSFEEKLNCWRIVKEIVEK